MFTIFLRVLLFSSYKSEFYQSDWQLALATRIGDAPGHVRAGNGNRSSLLSYRTPSPRWRSPHGPAWTLSCVRESVLSSASECFFFFFIPYRTVQPCTVKRYKTSLLSVFFVNQIQRIRHCLTYKQLNYVSYMPQNKANKTYHSRVVGCRNSSTVVIIG